MGAAEKLDLSETGEGDLARMQDTFARLRDPAGAIRMAVQLLSGPLRPALMRGGDTGPAVRSVLRALEQSSRELSELLLTADVPANDVTYAQVAGAQLVTLLDDVANEVCRRASVKAHIEVSVRDVLSPAISPAELSVALSGLLENAVEASVRAYPDFSPMVALHVFLRTGAGPQERFVVFEIHDRGDGLPEELQAWLREPSHASCESAGTSWRLARRIVEDAGGHVEWTRLDGTTHVRLCFPDH